MKIDIDMDKNYYELLGVSPDASLKEIKRAYRRAVRRHHPDIGTEECDEGRFKEIQEAYRVLANSASRGEYDAFWSRSGLVRDFVIDTDAAMSKQLESFAVQRISAADELFGRDEEPRRDILDIYCTLDLTPAEAARGGTFAVTVTRPMECDRCNGTGAAREDAIVPCDVCDQTGRVAAGSGPAALGVDEERPPAPRKVRCWKCLGDGELIIEACPKCRGEGYIEREVAIEIEIEPGTEDKAKLTVSGDGLSLAEYRRIQQGTRRPAADADEGARRTRSEKADAETVRGALHVFVRVRSGED